ncbi:glutamate--tRNA ligase [Ureaplasma canigenitalium]|uniref:glutamate--tRNA ligase n=1 Tax=Ureaplasma canigenitalium TaxID=42092 RepID=UPI0004E1F553|nr:glutamate--tRNA ligase [Ureaplasma canigenitalium]
MKIRTRYAPSPTGFLHIGGARTALFNYLYAKKNNGSFIIRIEDTDIERNVEGGADDQLDYLAWLGIKPDESLRNPNPSYAPYIQSKKLEKYRSLVNQLLIEKKAYRCFCTKEDLEHDRIVALKTQSTPKYKRHCLKLTEKDIDERLKNGLPYVVRLKIDDQKTYEWNDLIRGHISIPGTALTDPVILKSNGIAMYNFAVVVDDHDMEISHVIRGEEHISNTPYQLAIMEALGYEMTERQFAHLSIIVDENNKKLSKRNLSIKQFVSDYMNDGYFPHAITNFISLLGFSPRDNIEEMSMEKLIESFDLNLVSKAPAFFDMKKMNWFGNRYLNHLTNDEFIEFVKSHHLTKQLVVSDPYFLEKALLFKPQVYSLHNLIELIDQTFKVEPLLTDEDKEFIHNDRAQAIIKLFYEKIKNLNQYVEENIKLIIKEISKELSVKGKDLFMTIRIGASNVSHGPELAKIIFFLGKDRVLKNLENNLSNGDK